MILKLVSPDYRISQPVTSVPPTAQTAALPITLMDCMKVSYSVGPVVDILLGNEARLPLEYSDLRQVCNALSFMYFVFIVSLALMREKDAYRGSPGMFFESIL